MHKINRRNRTNTKQKKSFELNQNGGIAALKLIIIFSVLSAVIFTFKLLDENNDKLIIRNFIINDKVKKNNIYQATKFITEDKTLKLIDETVEQVIEVSKEKISEAEDTEIDSKASAEIDKETTAEKIGYEIDNANIDEDTNENNDERIDEDNYDKNELYRKFMVETLNANNYILKVEDIELSDLTGLDSYGLYYKESKLSTFEVHNFEDEEDCTVIRVTYDIIVNKYISAENEFEKNMYTLKINIPAEPFNEDGDLRDDIDYKNLVSLNKRFRYGDETDEL